VIYRSKLHATLKRNFQVMPGVQWLELLCKHVPDRHEHMVRYYGRYSSRTRGAERESREIEEPDAESASQAIRDGTDAGGGLINNVESAQLQRRLYGVEYLAGKCVVVHRAR